MKKINRILLPSMLALVFIFAYVPAGSAQEDNKEEFTLEEIKVTAQKREENQQKVPIAMEVITAEDIKELGKTTIDEILNSLPSTLIQKSTDGYRVSIRGITDDVGAISGQSVSAPTVAMNIDSVYSNRKDTGSSLYDIERVEVLYGPQSTMYTSNSPGGVINVITAQPKTDKFEVSGSIEAGNYSLLHTEGAVNVPLGAKTAIRASFTTSKRDGYITNGTDDQDTKSGRLKALYKPNDTFSINITAELRKDGGSGFGGGVEAFINQDDVDDPWIASTTSGEDKIYSFNDQTFKKFSGQIIWDASVGSLTITPSYARGKVKRASILDSDVQHQDDSSKEKGIEFRMTSPSDFFLKFVLGASFYKSEDILDMWQDNGDFAYRIVSNDSKAFYANMTYPISSIENLRLTFGYRKSWDEMGAYNREKKPGIDTSVVPQIQSQKNDGDPDVKYGFEYDLSNNSMLYGDYSTSYTLQAMSMGKSNGEIRTGEVEEPPTRLKAYTLGAKNRFLENRLQVNASAYYYVYRNYQANYMRGVWLDDNDDGIQDRGENHFDENSSGTGDGRILGFDLQTSVLMTRKDMLTVSVSYIDSEWTDLQFDYDYPYGYALDDNGQRITVYYQSDYKGKPMFNTPPWTISLDYSHNFTMPNGGSLKASINSKYRTAYRLSWNEDEYPYNYQESYHMEDINAVYSHSNGKWTLSGSVRNIFNYAEKKMYMNTGGRPMMSIGDPRTYSMILSLKF